MYQFCLLYIVYLFNSRIYLLLIIMAHFWPERPNLDRDTRWIADNFLWDWRGTWRPIVKLNKLLKDNFPNLPDHEIDKKAIRITRWCDNVDAFRQTINTNNYIEYNEHMASHLQSIEVEYEVCVVECFNINKVVLPDPSSAGGTILIDGKFCPQIILTGNEYRSFVQRQARAAPVRQDLEDEDLDLKEGDEAVNQDQQPTQSFPSPSVNESTNNNNIINCPQHRPVNNNNSNNRYEYRPSQFNNNRKSKYYF